MSVIPLINELEKNIKINSILVTTSTLSSAKVFNNFKFKKTIHQFSQLIFFISHQNLLNIGNQNLRYSLILKSGLACIKN